MQCEIKLIKSVIFHNKKDLVQELIKNGLIVVSFAAIYFFGVGLIFGVEYMALAYNILITGLYFFVIVLVIISYKKASAVCNNDKLFTKVKEKLSS